MGMKRLDTIADLVRHGMDLRVTCEQCGRVALLKALSLSVVIQRRNLPRDLQSVRQLLRCEGCGRKRPNIVPVMYD